MQGDYGGWWTVTPFKVCQLSWDNRQMEVSQLIKTGTSTLD